MAQREPVYRSVGDAGFALGHNGNLTNVEELAGQLGMLPGMVQASKDLDSTSDSDLVAELIAREYPNEPRSDGRDLEHACSSASSRSSRVRSRS